MFSFFICYVCTTILNIFLEKFVFWFYFSVFCLCIIIFCIKFGEKLENMLHLLIWYMRINTFCVELEKNWKICFTFLFGTCAVIFHFVSCIDFFNYDSSKSSLFSLYLWMISPLIWSLYYFFFTYYFSIFIVCAFCYLKNNFIFYLQLLIFIFCWFRCFVGVGDVDNVDSVDADDVDFVDDHCSSFF